MPAVKRSSPTAFPDLNMYWRRWERITRNGFSANGNRYSSTQVLQVWALVLGVLYTLLYLSGSGPIIVNHGSVNFDSSSELDTGFFRDRHLIFCISPGRAGSKYLRNVLNVAEGIIARHEPEPKMNGHILERVILQGRRRETFQERSSLKLRGIREALEGTPSDVAYAETSHMFVKTFADVVLEEVGNLAKVSIIFLRRPAKRTVWSQLRLGWFSKRHSGKNHWYYDPNDVHPSERQFSYSTNASDPIDTLIGYNADILQRGVALEHEVRKRHKRKEWRHVRVFEVLLMDISGNATEAGVLKLLSNLGLKVDRGKLSLLGKQDTNARDVKKDRVHQDGTIEDVESRLEFIKNKLPILRQVIY